MIPFLLIAIGACGPKGGTHHSSYNGKAAIEIHIPARNEKVQVDCMLRIVQTPFVTVHLSISNGLKTPIIVGGPSMRMHVARRPAPSEELRLFQGPSPWPTRDEFHLMLRDPDQYQTIEPNSSYTWLGGFEIVPASNGVWFNPGDSATEVLPFGCSASYWEEAEWDPENIRIVNVAESSTVNLRWLFSK